MLEKAHKSKLQIWRSRAENDCEEARALNWDGTDGKLLRHRPSRRDTCQHRKRCLDYFSRLVLSIVGHQ